MKWIFLLLLPMLACSDADQSKTDPILPEARTELSLSIEKSNTINDRFKPPTGFSQIKADSGSFAFYLQHLPLKPADARVKLYNGQLKTSQRSHAAVVDLPIGNKNLHQCADAIIRLRADYFYQKQAYDSIQFHFTNGFLADYERWRSGDGIKVIGNDVSWIEGNNTDTSHDHYWQYLEKVFMYAGTLSLDKELKPKKWEDLSIGDVLIQGGSPGHAVIVVNVAVNNAGEKVFMLAQSYMPAQEIHILKNPNDPELSPWYRAEIIGELRTPEWTFSKRDLMKF